jgi:hypothetical protein
MRPASFAERILAPVARLFVVFVGYGTARSLKVNRYLRQLRELYRPAELVVVDNANEATQWQRGGFHVIAGDNRLREFSGWDDGVTWLRQSAELCDEDWILFANDTVCRQAHLRWLTLGRARRVIRRLIGVPAGVGPCVAGPVAPFPTGSVCGFGGPFREFVATFFFAMPYRTYRRIGGLGVELPWDEWLGASWPAPLFRMPREADYNRFCNDWLGCDKPGGVGDWPGSSGRPFTAANYPFLRGKAQCILLESRLAAELTAQHPSLAVNIYQKEPWNEMWQRMFRLSARVARVARVVGFSGFRSGTDSR